VVIPSAPIRRQPDALVGPALAAHAQQRADVDRREVDPPIEVETATWAKAGQLDWWVKERREWWVACAVQTVVNAGSELLIFVPRIRRKDDPAETAQGTGRCVTKSG
jgi:hypothetical protein